MATEAECHGLGGTANELAGALDIEIGDGFTGDTLVAWPESCHEPVVGLVLGACGGWWWAQGL